LCMHGKDVKSMVTFRCTAYAMCPIFASRTEHIVKVLVRRSLWKCQVLDTEHHTEACEQVGIETMGNFTWGFMHVRIAIRAETEVLDGARGTSVSTR